MQKLPKQKMRWIVLLPLGLSALVYGCGCNPLPRVATQAMQATPTPTAADATAISSPTPIPATATPTTPAVAPSSEATSRPAASATSAAPSATATPGEVVVEVPESLLTERLNAELAGRWEVETALGRAAVRNLAVQLRNGRIGVTGDAQAGVVSLPLSMTLTVAVQAGRPVVEVREATVGGVPLPESTQQQMERTLQQEINQTLAGQDVRLRAITVEDGKLTARVDRV